MILRKAPPIYKPGDRKMVTKFAFKPIQLCEVQGFDNVSFEKRPDIIGETIWLERYIETYIAHWKEGKILFTFQKSERYNQAFLNKLCE